MSSLGVALLAGICLGALFGIQQHFRIKSGANRLALRNSDGSVYGGLVRMSVGVAVLWFAVGFGVAYGLTTLVRTVT